MEPWWGFNPRTHAGCDYAPHAIPTLMSGFNPRTHAGCDACAAAAAAPTPRFNPRTHAGCDQTDCVVRATPSMFQSTHPRRVRPNAASFPPTRCSHVSIHAPTQGATIPQHPGGRAGRRFNPRTHAGCDAAQLIGPLTEQEFQSTHPRRVRRWGRSGWPPLAWFQSTHPRRVRRAGVAWYGHTQRVSIHAPTQGATPASPGWPNRSKMFQSTHPRRVRLHLRARIDGFAGVSIHAPTQGATGQHDDRRQDPRVSIHAPTQGAT